METVALAAEVFTSRNENDGCVSQLLHKMRTIHLPELQSLYKDCVWLRKKLGVDDKKDLQSSEIRLLQFLSIVASVIQQINDFDGKNIQDNGQYLLTLESKITKAILPVKARLMEKLRNLDDPSEESWKRPDSYASNSGVVSSDVRSVEDILDEDLRMSCGDKSRSTDMTWVSSIGSGSCANSGSPVSVRSYPPNNMAAPQNRSSSFIPPAGALPPGWTASGGPCLSSVNLARNKQQVHHQAYGAVKSIPPSVKPKARKDNKQLKANTDPPSNFQNTLLKSSTSTDAAVSSVQNSKSSKCKRTFSKLDASSAVACAIDTGSFSNDNATPNGSGSAGASKNASDKSKKVTGKTPDVSMYYRSSVDFDLNSTTSNAAIGLSVAGGTANIKEEEYMSSRRRRRLNQIVPNPRKPRTADYACSLCNEPYQVTVQANPWWAVYSHECPKCKQQQIPRIDINQSSNAIELDPNIIALYGEGVADSGDDGEDNDDYSDGEYDSDSNAAEGGAGGGADDDPDGDEGEDHAVDSAVPPREEEKPFDGDGLLAAEEASKLLVLMCHARTCTGTHSSDKHAEICRSTKFLMLHIRDCKGVDALGGECKFPWCKPCKKMLRHLTQCYEPDTCTVCNPWHLPESFQQLRKLNQAKFCQPIQA